MSDPTPSHRQTHNSVKGDVREGSTIIQAEKITVHHHLRSANQGDTIKEGENLVWLGRPIAEWNPHDLEVHPAIQASDSPSKVGRKPNRLSTSLNAYVPRPHDDELKVLVDAAADGQSQMVLLVGSSSTGKTRSCWEAIQPLVPLGWRLWHPFDPTRVEAALDGIEEVRPRTVMWINEAQHYLGADSRIGERFSAALHSLLTSPERGPVLVLGTLWPEYANAYTTLPSPKEKDLHPQARELLTGRLLLIPEGFDNNALQIAKAKANSGDRQLAHALNHASGGRLPQFLAGAPELLRRYQSAPPAQQALLQSAMDARRLGVGLHLPLIFLAQAAEDYLTDDEFDSLEENWIEQALAEVSRSTHGNLAPLRPIRPRKTPTSHQNNNAGIAYRLADYLEQHGRQERWMTCPPLSFWEAAIAHLTDPISLMNLSHSARDRHRLYWEKKLTSVIPREFIREKLHTTKISRTNDSFSWSMNGATLDLDLNHFSFLLESLEATEDREARESIAWQLIRYGHAESLYELVEEWEDLGDQYNAERLAYEVAEAGYSGALVILGDTRNQREYSETGDDFENGDDLIQAASESGNPDALERIAKIQIRQGDRSAAEDSLQQAIEAGSREALATLAFLRDEIGDQHKAEDLVRKAAQSGMRSAIISLAEARKIRGDHTGAERLAKEAADSGGFIVHPSLFDFNSPWGTLDGIWPHGLNPDGTPSKLWDFPDPHGG